MDDDMVAQLHIAATARSISPSALMRLALSTELQATDRAAEQQQLIDRTAAAVVRMMKREISNEE
jgi:hypothetical protein